MKNDVIIFDNRNSSIEEDDNNFITFMTSILFEETSFTTKNTRYIDASDDIDNDDKLLETYDKFLREHVK